MGKYYIVFCFILFSAIELVGQVDNDDSENANLLPELTRTCYSGRLFSNEGAEPSGLGTEDCFSGMHNDVWFSFVAGATEVTITVVGNTSTDPGGNLIGPEVALYTQDPSGRYTTWRCATDEDFNNNAELIRGGLIVGQTYLIRVQGRDGNTGDFELCINNYNPPAEPGNDFVTASILCDKSQFTVQTIEGGGEDNDEANGTCLDVFGVSESSSSWFAWTAKTSGPLTFTLTPLRESDDIDFVVYELPNGVEDKTDKIALRCVATSCPGPTGLNKESTDLEEDFNCESDEDGFARYIDMEEGKSYGILINNFSDTGNGISIEFGDDPEDGEFEGPEVDFISDEPDNQVCVEEDVEFVDQSGFPNGTITNYIWTFGVDATPSTASGPGPHAVTYSSSGVKSVVLTIETDLGCKLTKISNFNVLSEMEFDPILTEPSCGGGQDGAINLQVSGGATPYEISWGQQPFQEQNFSLTNIAEGIYPFTARDGEGCIQNDTIELFEPGPALDASVEQFIPPTCNGDNDGQLVIAAVEGTPPFRFDFGQGLTNSNRATNLSAGIYPVYVVDAEGCDNDFMVPIEDPPVLTLDLDATDISCQGQNDGSAVSFGTGGIGEYQFSWSTGEVGPEITDLAPGEYRASLTDELGCLRETTFSIIDPPAINLNIIDAGDAICFDDPSGFIELAADGGAPPYEFALDGQTFQQAQLFENLYAGNYEVTIRDANGCTALIENIVINEPPPLSVEAGDDQVIDLGEIIDIMATSPDQNISFSWSGPDSLFARDKAVTSALPFQTGYYTATITDEDNCMAMDSLLVTVNVIRPIFAPNIFSPNGDGKNDNFTLFSGLAGKTIKSLRVFSRWGDLLYEGTNIPLNDDRFGWDGTANGEKLNTGVYAYFAEVSFIDGVVLIYEGDITLMR